VPGVREPGPDLNHDRLANTFETMQRALQRLHAPLVVTLIIALAACGGSNGSVPSSCPQGAFLTAINEYVEGSMLIDTEWEPIPDTDLKSALEAGGVACSYGIQEAEVGATLMWAPATPAFEERREKWKTDGQRQVDVAGVDEAWALEESNGTEQFLWQLNLLIDDVWIHIGATFLRDVESAQPLVDAAIETIKG